MAKWISNPDQVGAVLLDHLTHFRLSRQPHNFPEGAGETWWSVLLELKNTSIDQFAALTERYAEDRLIPVAYDAEDRALALPRQPLVIFARKALIEELNQHMNEYHVVSVKLGAIVPESHLDRAAQSPDTREITVGDDAVVMAVIDEGIAIAHDLFRCGETASRIEHASIFEAVPTARASHASVGRCFDRAEIDALLASTSFNGMLDEELFYTLSGQVDYVGDVFSTVAFRRSHGTHVTALAAGVTQDQSHGERPIICAALPSRLVEDTTGVDGLPDLYLAFHSLAKQARRFRCKNGQLAPVVFNLSFGNAGGPHDGTGEFAQLFELYFGPDAIFEHDGQKAWMTLPAGNSNLERLHAVDEAGDGPLSLALDVLPDDRTPSVVQMWMPETSRSDQTDFATIGVEAPMVLGQGQICTQPGESASLYDHDRKEIARLSYEFEGGATNRGLVTLSINPTASHVEDAVLAPAGQWQITITRNADAPQEPIHLWVRRDETLPGSLSGGRQAFFNQPDYVRFDRFGAPLAVDPEGTQCAVRRSGTLSGFSCGDSPIVVAGYSAREAELSDYSSAGPLNPRNTPSDRRGPDLAAQSDESYLIRGVLSAGSRSGSWVRQAGTSVAAPRVARAASDHIHTARGPARGWGRTAPSQYPIALSGRDADTRYGAGGAQIPVWTKD